MADSRHARVPDSSVPSNSNSRVSTSVQPSLLGLPTYSETQRYGPQGQSVPLSARNPFRNGFVRAADNFADRTPGLPGLTAPLPSLQPLRSSQDVLASNLRHFNAIWGNLEVEDRLTQLFINERQSVMSQAGPYIDLGVQGPLHPSSAYVCSSTRDDVFDRFMRDGLHWDSTWPSIPTTTALVAHHVRILRWQREWLLQAREVTIQAYESQLQLVTGLLERGEMRARGLNLGGTVWGPTGTASQSLPQNPSGPIGDYESLPLNLHLPSPSYYTSAAAFLDVSLPIRPSAEVPIQPLSPSIQSSFILLILLKQLSPSPLFRECFLRHPVFLFHLLC